MNTAEAAVRVFVGATTIAFVLYSWIGPQRIARAAHQASVIAGLFWGAASGFTSTIAQAGGPPYQMYVLSMQLPKMTFVGTSAIFFAVMNWLKVIPYVALGQFSTKGLSTSLVLVPLAIAANQLGFWLVRRISQQRFYQVTLVVMFVISLALLHSGIKEMLGG